MSWYLYTLYIFYVEDISYNKSTSQSHSQTDKYHGASQAVDRNTLTCTSTYNIGLNSSHKTVWLKVDLGGIFNIYGINIQFKNYEGYGMSFLFVRQKLYCNYFKHKRSYKIKIKYTSA